MALLTKNLYTPVLGNMFQFCFVKTTGAYLRIFVPLECRLKMIFCITVDIDNSCKTDKFKWFPIHSYNNPKICSKNWVRGQI